MKQSAVEWLVDELEKANYISKDYVIKQAKEMDKKQKDEFAIEFAEWCDLNATQKSKGSWYSNPLQIPIWGAKKSNELLEIFKNK